jgi:hypothetical protein
MPDLPVDLRTLVERQPIPIFQCPGCGSFLDAPRVNPSDGRLGRKCAACRDWHPVAAEHFLRQ